MTAEKLITGISAQPEFPREDLSDANADMLELLLANKGFVEQSHLTSEELIRLFKIAHFAILHGSSSVYEGNRVDAVSHGVSVFEAMSLAVASRVAERVTMFAVNTRAAKMMTDFADESLRGNSVDAISDFREELPRAAEVITTASRRFHGHLTDYALLGAALEWRIELESASV